MTTWLSLSDAGEALRLNPETVRLLAKRGDLPGARKFGGKWRIPSAALEPDTTPKSLIAPPSKRSLAQQRRTR